MFVEPRLPGPLLPTMAIQMAPPAVAGVAWFAINGDQADGLALALAGYAVLMAMVQLRLVPLFRTAPFGPAWWAFSFCYAAVFLDAIHWLSAEDVSHAPPGPSSCSPSSPCGRRPRRTHRRRRLRAGRFLPAPPLSPPVTARPPPTRRHHLEKEYVA